MTAPSTFRFTVMRMAVAALGALNVPAAAHEQPRTVSLPAANSAMHRTPSVLARAESPMLSNTVEEFAARELGEASSR